MEILHKALEWAFNKFIKKDPSECDHIWHVYGTALNDHCIEVICIYCHSWGKVEDHTLEEWTKAGSNDIKPYEWKDVDRIVSPVLEPLEESIKCNTRNHY